MSESNIAQLPDRKESEESPSVTFTRDEVVLLWQLINNQSAGTPFSVAHVAADLYRTINELASLHGVAPRN